MIVLSKICSKCKKKLPATAEYFYRCNANKDGLRYECKECVNEDHSKWTKTDKGREYQKKRARKYYKENKEMIRAKFKTPEAIKKRKEYYQKNREKFNKYSKEYQKKHPECRKQIRISRIKHSLIDYFFERYCKYGRYISRYKPLYDNLCIFLKKYNIKIDIKFFTNHITKNGNINLSGFNVRPNQKKIIGIKLNERGKKRFGINNLSNLEIKTKDITSQQACIELSCKIGRDKLQEIYKSLDPSIKKEIDFEKLLEFYKKIETYLFKINKPRGQNIKIAVALYLSSHLTQDQCGSISECTSMALRNLYKLLPIKKKIATKYRKNKEI